MSLNRKYEDRQSQITGGWRTWTGLLLMMMCPPQGVHGWVCPPLQHHRQRQRQRGETLLLRPQASRAGASLPASLIDNDNGIDEATMREKYLRRIGFRQDEAEALIARPGDPLDDDETESPNLADLQ